MTPHPIYPEVLMTTEAVSLILDDPSYKVFEVDLDPASYAEGHLRNAIPLDWEQQLRNTETYDILTPAELSKLLGDCGVERHHKIVIYGDNNNWFGCWAFWLLYMAGHENIWIMDGGRKKWFAEGREITTAVPAIEQTVYEIEEFDTDTKASTEQIFESFFQPDTHRLIDVRSAAEYEGRQIGPAGAPYRCAVGGHIPNAINIPWNLNCNTDGTFKAPDELAEIYRSFDILEDSVVITYCAIGERASLSWFVIKHLLKRSTVMNYDRSMAQWSRLANAPLIDRGAA